MAREAKGVVGRCSLQSLPLAASLGRQASGKLKRGELYSPSVPYRRITNCVVGEAPVSEPPSHEGRQDRQDEGYQDGHRRARLAPSVAVSRKRGFGPDTRYLGVEEAAKRRGAAPRITRRTNTERPPWSQSPESRPGNWHIGRMEQLRTIGETQATRRRGEIERAGVQMSSGAGAAPHVNL